MGITYAAGPEALLAWLYLEAWSGGQLEDPAGVYGEGLEALSALELLSVVRRARDLLLQRGIAVEWSADGPSSAPALVITRDYRIFLGSRRGPEIRMRPMTKAVFLLFLRHPEGLRYDQITLYRPELEMFYRRLSKKGSNAEIARCLDRLLEEGSKEVNVAASRVAQTLASLIDQDWLWAYVISGERGGAKRIQLDRRLVTWL